MNKRELKKGLNRFEKHIVKTAECKTTHETITILQDMANGINTGFSGWIWTKDLCDCMKKYRKEIVSCIEEFFEECGTEDNLLYFCKKFNCKKSEFYKTLYAKSIDDSITGSIVTWQRKLQYIIFSTKKKFTFSLEARGIPLAPFPENNIKRLFSGKGLTIHHSACIIKTNQERRNVMKKVSKNHMMIFWLVFDENEKPNYTNGKETVKTVREVLALARKTGKVAACECFNVFNRTTTFYRYSLKYQMKPHPILIEKGE